MIKTINLRNHSKYIIARLCSYKAVPRPDLASNRKKTAPKIEKIDRPAGRGDLCDQLKTRILNHGPITVADYMREVLTNPLSGYYMNSDVFGKEGDFVTSPEISQIFGEIIAIWVIIEWQKLGSPTPFQIVEMGPGRGTLARDVLKVLTQFKLGGKFSMHMVEISPFLSKLQAQRICYKHESIEDINSPHYQKGESATGTKIFWHRCLEQVPEGFSIVLAHEFFDALPVHKLQLDSDGKWKEILIDVVPEGNDNGKDFRYVLSKSQTAISQLYEPIEGDQRQCLEYSVESDRIVSLLSKRIDSDGGFSLIMDYGHCGEKTDTFRAFKQHKLHEPLSEPGTADLTADVDFRQIKRVAEEAADVICIGPVEQGTFLKRMQGDVRMENLVNNALPENQDKIKAAYKMLTDVEQMGERFKFLSIFPAVVKDHLEKFPVNGFHE